MIEDIAIEAVEAEKAALSAMMQDERATSLAQGLLRPDDFYDGRHQVLFRTLTDWHRHEGGAVEVLALSDILRGSGRLDAAGGIDYVSEVATEVYTAANIDHDCRMVQDKAIARKAIENSRQMVVELQNANGCGSSEIIAKHRLPEYGGRGLDVGTTSAEMLEAEGALYAEAEEKTLLGLAYRGIDCGFSRLNYYLNGLCADELTVLAADQSVGKTTFALSVALSVAGAGHAVGIFSLEMTQAQVGGVLVRLQGDLDPEQYRKGRLDDQQASDRDTARLDLRGMPISVFDQVPYRIAQIEAAMKHREAKGHVALWVVDYLQRIRMDDGDEREISLVTAALKGLTMELHTHILLLSQFSWRTRERPDRRPRMNDMKGSSSIEQDANNVVMIYRPGFFDEVRTQVEKKKGVEGVNKLMRHAELIIGKTRNGPTGAEEIMWVPEKAYFTDKPEER